MQASSAVTTFLFTDIEGSTRLWEREPERMHDALAQHDALAHASVAAHRGRVVKTTGDGIHAVFTDPLDAVEAAVALQLALADAGATAGVPLKVRCGLHAGVDSRRDNDFYGNAVNRAARVMSVAHGGQILASHSVATLVSERLPGGVTLRELGAVRLRDLTQPELVYQVVHSMLRQQFPALRSLEATPNNLPLQITSFIGREHELAEVRRQLRQARLLTLVGIGGLGKSRLSLQVAADALDEYPNGVWFVELAPVTDATLVPQVVASVLGVKEEAGRSVEEALVRFVRDRNLLLVLDNCEHLTDACARLSRHLLEAGAQIKILASSRERLNIAGEKAYPLAPLAVPLPQQRLALDALAQFASVRLFVDRAVAARPDFTITSHNAAAVADICHRLDGIPLALELAAARVRAMTVDKIAERLGDRFKLLARGDRTALPRQQTLRALIDWSHDLLDAAEKSLFAKLSIFAGGFTLEAAEFVGAVDGGDDGDVLELLTSLVEKSLVILDAEHDRYRMLETVRQYAAEWLERSAEEDAVRRRHLAFFVAWTEQARPELVGPRSDVWLAKLDAERENIMVAHASCGRSENGGQLGLQLVRAVKSYLANRGLWALGYRWLVEALERNGADGRTLSRCRALTDAGQFANALGRYAEALPYLEQSLALAREIGDDSRIAAVLQPLGRAHSGLASLGEARACLESALALAEKIGNKREIAAALSALAQVHFMEGSLETAQPLNRRAHALACEVGDHEGTAFVLLNLAMLATVRSEFGATREMLVEVLAIVDRIGSKTGGQSLIDVAAGLAAAQGQWNRAARWFGAAEVQSQLSGLHREPADQAFVAARVATVRDALGAESFTAANLAGSALDYVEAIDEVRSWLHGPETG